MVPTDDQEHSEGGIGEEGSEESKAKKEKIDALLERIVDLCEDNQKLTERTRKFLLKKD